MILRSFRASYRAGAKRHLDNFLSNLIMETFPTTSNVLNFCGILFGSAPKDQIEPRTAIYAATHLARALPLAVSGQSLIIRSEVLNLPNLRGGRMKGGDDRRAALARTALFQHGRPLR